jgi:hypothetical protein
MPLRAKQIAAATAVVGATILGGAALVAAQDVDDSPTTTVPDDSPTTVPDDGSTDGREAPSDGSRSAPDGREHARGENCPDKDGGSSDTQGDADGDTEGSTQASSLAA